MLKSTRYTLVISVRGRHDIAGFYLLCYKNKKDCLFCLCTETVLFDLGHSTAGAVRKFLMRWKVE